MLLSNTSLGYEDIGNLTPRQLEAILARLNKHISLKMGLPSLFGSPLTPSLPAQSKASPSPERRVSTINDLKQMQAMFGGL